MSKPAFIAFATIAAVVSLALVAAAFTGWLAERREKLIKTRQASAGVARTEVVAESNLNDFLFAQRNSAKHTVRVLAISGRLFLPGPAELVAGVSIGLHYKILLLDPMVDNLVFKENSSLKQDTSAAIERLLAAQTTIGKAAEQTLDIR